MDLISIKVFISCFFAFWAIMSLMNFVCGITAIIVDMRNNPTEYRNKHFIVFLILVISLATILGPIAVAVFISLKADVLKKSPVDDEVDELDEDELYYRQENSCNQMTTI